MVPVLCQYRNHDEPTLVQGTLQNVLKDSYFQKLVSNWKKIVNMEKAQTVTFPTYLTHSSPEYGGNIFRRNTGTRPTYHTVSTKQKRPTAAWLARRSTVCRGQRHKLAKRTARRVKLVGCHSNRNNRSPHCSEGQQLLEENTCAHGDVTEHLICCRRVQEEHCVLQVEQLQ